jgi:hypothetical protein
LEQVVLELQERKRTGGDSCLTDGNIPDDGNLRLRDILEMLDL